VEEMMAASSRLTAAFALAIVGLAGNVASPSAAILEPARAWVPRQAVEDAARAFLPIHFDGGSASSLALVDVMYAGAVAGDLGVFLGVVTTGPQSESSVLFDRSDTPSSVQQILDRSEKTLANVPWLAVVSIDAGWADGSFAIKIREQLGLRAGAASSTRPAADTLVGRTVFAIETSSLVAPGGRTPLRMSLKGRFFETGAYLSIEPAAELLLPVAAPPASAPLGENGQLHLPFSFLNWALSYSLANDPVVLGGGATSVQMTGLAVSRDGDALVLVGASPGDSESTWKVEARFRGTDASLDALSIASISCGRLTAVDCLAERARRALFAGTLLGVYRGMRLHPTTPRRVSLSLAGRSVQVVLDIRRVSVSSDGIDIDIGAWRAQP
jgi:hypothetical protein